jgi:flagellar basal-body rod protein FlgB
MKIFNTNSIQLLKKSLDVYSKQHEAIAKNIANANNDAYSRTDTDFSKVLQHDLDRNLKVTNKKHIQSSNTPAQKSPSEMSKKEKVDVNREMGELAENQIRYDFAARVLNRKYRSLSQSITGRIS